MIETEALRESLNSPESVQENGFALLSDITYLVNSPQTIDIGREMIIRALAHKDSFSEDEKMILNHLIRAVGLFPYINDTENELHDQLALELHRPDNLGDNVVFHSVQAKIYNELINGNNVVLAAPTSVGKSLIVDGIIASNKYRKIVIVVPTLALIDEIRKRISVKFSDQVKVITHREQEAAPSATNIYILTQERVLQRTDLEDTEFFVIDEFYKLDFSGDPDDQRVAQLNLAFYMLSRTGAVFYLSGPSVRSIKGIEKYDCHFISSPFTTVAVDIKNYDLPTQGEERNETLLSLWNTLEEPTIIYCQSPPSTRRVTELLLAEGERSLEYAPTPAVLSLVNWISENYAEEWVINRALMNGIAIHHGAVPRAIQQQLIKLFNLRELHTIVCTSTIIEGVNTAAKNVIIYDRRRNKNVIDHFTYKNIQGRAGRMGKYFIGKVFVLEKAPDETHFDVNISIGSQDEETPLSLIANIHDDDLTNGSRERLRHIMRDDALPLDVIRSCKGISPEKLIDVANYIRENLDEAHDALAWNNHPTRLQMNFTCDLIVDFLSNKSMSQSRIHSGEQLAGLVFSVGLAGGLPGFILQKVQEARDEFLSPSDAIEDALKISRNVVMHRVPTDLMAIHHIQQSIFSQLNLSAGDYRAYSSKLENGFLPHAVLTLDEYGIPVQIGMKISSRLPIESGIDAVLNSLKTNSFENLQLNPFERDLISEVKDTL